MAFCLRVPNDVRFSHMIAQDFLITNIATKPRMYVDHDHQ